MIFKLYDCDVGIKVDGVTYQFPHVASVTMEDPERNKLTRGANAGNKIGLAYKEGITEPKRITVPIMDMSIELQGVMKSAFENQTRVDFFCVARSDGSSKLGKQCLLSNMPQQLNLDETAESLQVAIELETFDLVENHKS